MSHIWANAGGKAVLQPTAANQVLVGRVGKLTLPEPKMVTVQIGESTLFGQSTTTGCIILGRVDWQSGRGSHRAYFDVYRGTTFTVAAADSVEVTILYALSAFVPSVPATFNCTMAPAATINPMPATLTIRAPLAAATPTSIGRVTTIGPWTLSHMPAYARKLTLSSTVQNAAAGCLVELLSGGVAIIADSDTRASPLYVNGVPYDDVFLTSPVACTANVHWELML